MKTNDIGMNIPFHIDLIRNHSVTNPNFTRTAARAIIHNDKGAVLMLESDKGDYKFPGGGVKERETPEAALKRKVMEETGRTVEVTQYLGRAEELKRDFYDFSVTFEMISYYYACSLGGIEDDTEIEAHEATLELKAEWVHPLTALRTNEDVTPKLPWVRRESEVLKRLLE